MESPHEDAYVLCGNSGMQSEDGIMARWHEQSTNAEVEMGQGARTREEKRYGPVKNCGNLTGRMTAS